MDVPAKLTLLFGFLIIGGELSLSIFLSTTCFCLIFLRLNSFSEEADWLAYPGKEKILSTNLDLRLYINSASRR